ncbi:MAG: regulatory protein RecX [Candidatus Shapirobacteria bacterium]|jgi:SOS response regulatory protein OraA/RecX
MHITSIKPTRSSTTLILVFSNGSILPFSSDDWVKAGIKKFSELDPNLLDQIYKKSAEHQLKEYAVRQLAMRSLPEKIIKQKLKHYSQKFFLSANIENFSVDVEPIITQIIANLRNLKLINNSAYASGYAAKSTQKSKRQIIAELNQKGISPLDQNQAVLNLNDLEKIKNFLKKKGYTNEKLSSYAQKNKIMAALYRRGFTISDIKSVVDDLIKNG